MSEMDDILAAKRIADEEAAIKAALVVPVIKKEGEVIYKGIPGILGSGNSKIPKVGDEYFPRNKEDVDALEYQVSMGVIEKI